MRKSKTALVTGASGGLGLEFARLLAKKHYDLVLVARNEGKLNGIRSELEKEYGITAWVCPCDLSRVDAALGVYQFTQAHDLEINVLINNAGFGDSGKFVESNWQKLKKLLVPVAAAEIAEPAHRMGLSTWKPMPAPRW